MLYKYKLNCFLDFAVEHWFGCRTTEPAFARDIGAIELYNYKLHNFELDPRNSEI